MRSHEAHRNVHGVFYRHRRELAHGGSRCRPGGPTGPSATETIARLQADGKRVIINKVGSGPLNQCTVTDVRSVVVRPQAKTVTIHGLPDFEPIPTVHVNLKC